MTAATIATLAHQMETNGRVPIRRKMVILFDDMVQAVGSKAAAILSVVRYWCYHAREKKYSYFHREGHYWYDGCSLTKWVEDYGWAVGAEGTVRRSIKKLVDEGILVRKKFNGNKTYSYRIDYDRYVRAIAHLHPQLEPDDLPKPSDENLDEYEWEIPSEEELNMTPQGDRFDQSDPMQGDHFDHSDTPQGDRGDQDEEPYTLYINKEDQDEEDLDFIPFDESLDKEIPFDDGLEDDLEEEQEKELDREWEAPLGYSLVKGTLTNRQAKMLTEDNNRLFSQYPPSPERKRFHRYDAWMDSEGILLNPRFESWLLQNKPFFNGDSGYVLSYLKKDLPRAASIYGDYLSYRLNLLERNEKMLQARREAEERRERERIEKESLTELSPPEYDVDGGFDLDEALGQLGLTTEDFRRS